MLTQDEYELAMAGNTAQDKEIATIRQTNELAYEDIISSIDHSINRGHVACKIEKKPKESLLFEKKVAA